MQRMEEKERLLAAVPKGPPRDILKEVEALRQEKASLQADKDGLVHTVQKLLVANHSDASEELQKSTIVVEMKKKQNETEQHYRQKILKMEKDHQQRVGALEKKLKEPEEKQEDNNDVTQTLESQNSGLYINSDKLSKELQKCKADVKDLGGDKRQLVASLQDLLRQNIKYQEELS